MTFEQIKKLLDMIHDPVEKLEAVMDIGKNSVHTPDSAVCTDIPGCASFVQICRDGNNFYVNADSAIVRGIATILVSAVNGKTPSQIKKMPLDKMFADLNINIGAARLNGVNSMIRFLKNL